jgi:hypothetical protein
VNVHRQAGLGGILARAEPGFADGARGSARPRDAAQPPIELTPQRPQISLTLATPLDRRTGEVDDDAPIRRRQGSGVVRGAQRCAWNEFVVASSTLRSCSTPAHRRGGPFAFTSLCDGGFDLQVASALRPRRSRGRERTRAGSASWSVRSRSGGLPREGDGCAQRNAGRRFAITAYETPPTPTVRRRCAVGNAEGDYELRVPSHGAWRIAVRASGFAPWISQARQYDEAEFHLDVPLLPERDLRLRLLDQRGERVRRARVICSDTDGRPVATMISTDYWLDRVPVGPDGEVLLAKLPASIVRIEVRLPDLQTLEPYSVDLRRAAREHVRDRRSAGSRRAAAEVLLELKEAAATVDLERSPEGRFLVEAFDAHGVLCASFAARFEGGLCAFEKPLDYQILRYLDAGPLRDRGIEHAARDPLGGDQIASIVDPSMPTFRVPLPMGPGRIRVTAQNRAPAEVALPRSDRAIRCAASRCGSIRKND